MSELTPGDRLALEPVLLSDNEEGDWLEDEVYPAVERIVAAHVARATADAETRLAAVREAVEPADPPMGTRDALASRDGAFVVQRVLAALDPAPTTDRSNLGNMAPVISLLREIKTQEAVPTYLRAEADQALGECFGIEEP